MHRALLFAYGITVEMLVRLIDAGLATATAERMVAGNKTIEVARMRITEAGAGAGEDVGARHGDRSGGKILKHFRPVRSRFRPRGSTPNIVWHDKLRSHRRNFVGLLETSDYQRALR